MPATETTLAWLVMLPTSWLKPKTPRLLFTELFITALRWISYSLFSPGSSGPFGSWLSGVDGSAPFTSLFSFLTLSRADASAAAGTSLKTAPTMMVTSFVVVIVSETWMSLVLSMKAWISTSAIVVPANASASVMPVVAQRRFFMACVSLPATAANQRASRLLRRRR